MANCSGGRAQTRSFRGRVNRIGQHYFGVDYNILTTLLFRGWSICAGGLTLVILPFFLSPTEQGYYYTFANVLALQIFFELGLNQVITQFVSHDVAHLRFTEDETLEGSAHHLGRLASLVRMIRAWYFVAAFLFVFLTGFGGLVFFAIRNNLPMAQWLGVWVILVISTAVNLRLSPVFAVIEGCGRVGEVATMRLQQSILGYLVLWVGLALHCGLWAAAALPAISAFYSSYWLWRHGKLTKWLVNLNVSGDQHLNWRRDIFPMQWRIAISWMAGYFLFNILTPIVFWHWGPVEAGQIGLSLAIFSAISTVGMSWVNATAPVLAMHVSRGERTKLNSIFLGVVVKSTIFTFFICIVVLGMAWFCVHMHVTFMNRIAPLSVLVSLALITVANSIVFSFAVYMRSHKEEPMLLVSVISALLTIAALYFGVRVNISIMMLLYLAVTILVTLPWTTVIFLQYFRRIK